MPQNIILFIIFLAGCFLVVFFLQKIKEIKSANEVLQKKIKLSNGKLLAANKKIIKTVEAKNDFISIVAHELRAPLTVVKGYLSMLYEGAMGELSEKQISAIIKAYRGNDDLIYMIENLLNFSRIKDGKIKYIFGKVELGEIVQSALEQFEIQINSKKLKISATNKPKDLPLVDGDANKLKNIVSNLLGNAIKHSEDGDKINIDITANDKDIIFEMIDNGVGMAPADAKRLFEKFSQNKEMSFERVQGAGLGLYIIARFVSAHKGKVWASSPGLGKGSAFGFSLPR
ncbi:MAG: HAMP domain-containing sensor histidine kinase [bacterium]